MKKKKLLISFSGGRTSAFMVWWLHNVWPDRHNWEMKVVFANTGLEASGTLVFVHRCSWQWNIPITWVEARHLDENGNPFSEKGWKVKHQVVDFYTAAKKPFKGVQLQNPKYWKSEWSWTPYEEMVSVLGIPSTNAPFCSDQLKAKPIKSYMKSIGWKKYYTAIGMRYDEPGRISVNAEEERLFYPLNEYTVLGKWDIMAWWKTDSDFDLEINSDEGNCDRCWKKNLKLLVSAGRRDPDSYGWWQYITDKYGNYNPRNTHLQPPFNFYRGNMSPKDILALRNVPDEEINRLSKKHKKYSCSESCEAF